MGDWQALIVLAHLDLDSHRTVITRYQCGRLWALWAHSCVDRRYRAIVSPAYDVLGSVPESVRLASVDLL